MLKYLKGRDETEGQPERDHTELLTEQLQKAAQLSKKTYIEANKVVKTKFVIKNKKASLE